MQELIKTIRQYTGLSQQEFADRLGVTFATINRWENGKAIPNQLAQSKLYEFCKTYSIPVNEMTNRRIQKAVSSLDIEEGRIILYHGSKSGLSGPIAPISRKKCDFGAGFYMGTKPDQPLTLICDFDKSGFYIVSIDMSQLKSLEVPADLDWAMIVACNRGKMEEIRGTSFYKKYSELCRDQDVIIGSIANDRMFYVLDNFFLGNITDQALVKSLSALQLGRQYVAVTQKACDAVRIEAEVTISSLERMILRDISEENRAKGTKAANDICKSYRREGRFFDEILDYAKEA